MAGTILGPGTIFLMLVGAFVAAFRMSNWLSFQYNIYPIVFFMLACFLLKSNHQVSFCVFVILRPLRISVVSILFALCWLHLSNVLFNTVVITFSMRHIIILVLVVFRVC